MILRLFLAIVLLLPRLSLGSLSAIVSKSGILVDVSFHVRAGSVKMATTRNVYAERSNQVISASLSGNLVKGEDFLQAYSFDVVRDAVPDCDRLLQKLLQKYQRAEQQATIKSGTFSVLFTPSAAGSTIGGLFRTILSGQAVAQKSSPLAEKVGEKLFDERLTIFEDPNIGASACIFDD